MGFTLRFRKKIHCTNKKKTDKFVKQPIEDSIYFYFIYMYIFIESQ